MINQPTQAIEDTVRGYVAAGSSLDASQVIPGNDNGPVHNGLFATVLLVNTRTEGQLASRTVIHVDGIQQMIETAIQDVYSVQWFRSGATDVARRFHVWTASAEAQEYMTRAGLSFVRTSEIRRLDSIISDAWEERAGLDLEIRYIRTLRQDAKEARLVPITVAQEWSESKELEVDYGAES